MIPKPRPRADSAATERDRPTESEPETEPEPELGTYSDDLVSQVTGPDTSSQEGIVTTTTDAHACALTDHLRLLPESTEDGILEVRIYWQDTLLDAVHARDRSITAGSEQADLLDVGPTTTLATHHGSTATVFIPEGTELVRKTERGVAPEIAHGEHHLRAREALAFRRGPLTLVMRLVEPAKISAVSGADWEYARIFAISAMTHACAVVAAFTTPETSNPFDELRPYFPRSRTAKFEEKKKEKKKKKPEVAQGRIASTNSKRGLKGEKKQRSAPRTRKENIEIAQNAGILRILNQGGALGSMMKSGGLGVGINVAMSQLQGNQSAGFAGGAGGIGTRGTRAGGFAQSVGIGIISGGGRRPGSGGDISIGRTGRRTTITPSSRQTILRGGLKREDISRVIRPNLPRFKHCYEKELNRNPNLTGKVAVHFVIAPTGRVASAKVRETTMDDERVEACVLRVVRSLQFKKPTGGGIVIVTYPFLFAST